MKNDDCIKCDVCRDDGHGNKVCCFANGGGQQITRLKECPKKHMERVCKEKITQLADYIIIARSCAMRIGRFFDCLEDKENTIRFYITSDILGDLNSILAKYLDKIEPAKVDSK